MGRDKVELIVRRKGYIVSKLATEADLEDDQQLRRLLVDVVRRDGRDESQIGDYEMEIRYAGARRTALTHAATGR
jgi:integrase